METTAFRRAAVIFQHILSTPIKQHMLQVSGVSSDASEKRMGIRPAEEVQQDFTIREYDMDKDIVGFTALDYLCCQGVTTKLVTEFLMKYTFEHIQPRGWCCIAEDQSGNMVGSGRSYVYDCLVNGKSASVSYVFLIRVHPHFRRRNLALWLTTQLFFHDLQVSDIDYMSSWVVVDNVHSITLQDKIAKSGASIHGMPEPDTLSTYLSIGCPLPDILQDQEFKTSEAAQEQLDKEAGIYFEKVRPEDEVELARHIHAKTQFLPNDLDALFGAQFHVGTYVMRRGDKEIVAYINVWNSGEIRVSTLRDSNVRSDGSFTAYNPWFEPSPEGARAFHMMISLINIEMAQQNFKFAFFFFPEDYEMNQKLMRTAKMNIPWKARIWYVSNQTKIDTTNFPSIFYDPRQCLM